MAKLHFLMLAPALVLGACVGINKPQTTNTEYTNGGNFQPQATQPVTTQNLGEPSAAQDGLCPSDEYAGLMGKKYQDIPQDNLPPYFRTLTPGQNLVMSQPARVNLYLDRRGVVTAVRCG